MSDALRTSTASGVLGALALELAPGSPVARDRVPQAEAGRLAAQVAADLAGFEPEAAQLDLVRGFIDQHEALAAERRVAA